MDAAPPPIDVHSLQKRLGVAVDGDFGVVSFTALFAHLGAQREIAEELAVCAAVKMSIYDMMANRRRLAHFLAQLLHESDGLRAMEEYASGRAYEGRADLGNVRKGDGVRYKGRGPIQLTGRANYREYGRALGFDFERHPQIVALPSIGLLVALEYWHRRRLNRLADADDLKGITLRINGGYNGLADRQANLRRMKALLT